MPRVIPTKERNSNGARQRTPSFMSVVTLDALLREGIPANQMSKFRDVRISGHETLADYVNFLLQLGAVRFDKGKFIRPVEK